MIAMVVAAYRTLPDPEQIRRELVSAGIPPGDVRISEYVDPVVTNAPGSIEKESGFFDWLTGIPDLDLDAYRRAIERGRTFVSVRAPDAQIGTVESILERYDPVEIDEADAATAPDLERPVERKAQQKRRVRRYAMPGEKIS